MYKNLLNYFDVIVYLNDFRSWTVFINWSLFIYFSRLSTVLFLVRILLELVLIGDIWLFFIFSRAWEIFFFIDDICRDMFVICGAGIKYWLLYWYREYVIINIVYREIYVFVIFFFFLFSFLSRGILVLYYFFF